MYCIQYGQEFYGPYESYAKAFWAGMTNFGAFGWRIVKNGQREE